MNTLIGWVSLVLLVALGFAAGTGAVVLVIAYGLVSALAAAVLGREDAYLEQTGQVAPWRVSAAQALYILAAAVMLVLGPGAIDSGPVWRVLIVGATVALAYLRLRQVLALPGADRLELALGAVKDRQPVLLRVVLTGGGVLTVAGTVLGIPFAGAPLLLALGGLVVWGWKPAGRRAVTVTRLRAAVANASRIGEPQDVAIEPGEWLAGSDDMLDTATATLPATWLPPPDPAPLVDALRAAGWHADLHPEEKVLALARAEAVLPLPERVELDPAEAPDGLALRVGWWRDPDTDEQGWAWWDPDAADPHLLCVGPTRSGKSVALRCLLAQALAGGWEVIIADPKGVDYRWAADLPGVRWARGDTAYEAIDEAVEEMRRRQTWLEEHAPATAANLGEVPENPYEPVLVIVDETAELVELGGEGAPKERKERMDQTVRGLGSLARRSRFVQIVMCVATQRPDASVIAGEIRGNLGTRVLTGEGEQQHKLMAFGPAEVEPLPANYPRGRGRLMVGGAGPHELQVPWISAEDILAAHRPVEGAEPEGADDYVPEAWEEQHAESDGGTISLELDPDDEEERP